MTSMQLAMLVVHAIAIVWAWQWYADRDRVWLLLLIALLLPVVSWPFLLPQGVVAHGERHAKRQAQLRAEQAAQRAKAVAFLRSQLADGTPVEQDNARQLLSMWNESEQAPPPPSAQLISVVGGLPRKHYEPPSLALIQAGCDCPACLDLAGAISGMRSQSGWTQALERVTRQVSSTLSGSPSYPLPEVCHACEREEFAQRNAMGQIVIKSYGPTKPCAAHARKYLKTFDTPR